MDRVRIIRLLDALEVGDQELAADVLLNALEDGSCVSDTTSGPPPCPTCGVRAWPGETWRHVWTAHQRAEMRRAA